MMDAQTISRRIIATTPDSTSRGRGGVLGKGDLRVRYLLGLHPAVFYVAAAVAGACWVSELFR